MTRIPWPSPVSLPILSTKMTLLVGGEIVSNDIDIICRRFLLAPLLSLIYPMREPIENNSEAGFTSKST